MKKITVCIMLVGRAVLTGSVGRFSVLQFIILGAVIIGYVCVYQSPQTGKLRKHARTVP